jgi:hypothetical protein
LCLLAALAAAPCAVAQAPPADGAAARQAQVERLREELSALRDEYAARLASIEERLAALESPREAATQTAAPTAGEPVASAPVPAGATGAGGPSGVPPVYGGAAATSKIFNPDVAVIGNFVGAAGRGAGEAEPALAFREAEVSFQAVVDPYARADFFLTFGPDEVGVEEAAVTFTDVPGDFLLKAGKLRTAFGAVDAMHVHALPWTDRPLMTRNLVGGEEGLADAGLSLSRLIPNPWLFLEATGQVYRGSSAVFQGSQRADLTWLGHLRAYRDLSESTNLDLGGSIAYGSNDAAPGAHTRLVGLDATWRWRPLRRALYRRALARTELVWSRREQPGGAARAFGAYLDLQYQFGRRWVAGARFDTSERADDPTVRDRGASALLTWWPSEFSQIRAQYRHTRLGDERRAHELLLQLLFAIGAHGAHAF